MNKIFVNRVKNRDFKDTSGFIVVDGKSQNHGKILYIN